MTNFSKGNEYFGFKLLNVEEVQDISSIGYTFLHIKSGAQLFYVQNDDDNKVFFISFKTPPNDDYGTAHILEHSVLCGSKKYCVKDPFNEMAKGSLNTYLNALTYSDKTMYPIASRNEKDFCNLMDVYLDAVFNTLISDKKEIFMQEGWHFEIENKDSPLEIKGVVYNEMKGALSNPDRILNNSISKSLFPNSIYKYESGGDPDFIPELTYEMFLDFYNKYYHPSNSFIYLYGDVDICERLKYLNDEYLINYCAKNMNIEIKSEQKFSSTSYFEDTYPVAKCEDNGFGDYAALSFVIGKSTDTRLSLAFDILNYILLGTNGSPIKNAVIGAGICESAEGMFDSSSFDMVYSIVAKKADKNKIQLFKQTILSKLKEISENGIDKKLIESCLNIWEFLLHEEKYDYRPKGLVYGMRIMKSWLHGYNPSECLEYLKLFQSVRDVANEGYFEELIKDCIVGNTHSSFVVIKPEEGKQIITDEKNKLKFEQIKKSMSEGEIEEIINDTKTLRTYQSKPENIEALQSIPLLSINEVSTKSDIIKNRVGNEFGCPILFTPLDTNDIVYVHLLFDIGNVPHELIPYVGLLADILGEIDTEKYSYSQIQTEMNMYTGGIHLYCMDYSTVLGCEPKLVLEGKSLTSRLDNMFDIFSEIILNSRFDNLENLKNIIKEIKLEKGNSINNNGHTAAINRSRYLLSEGSKYKEQTTGICYYMFLSEIEKQIDYDAENVINNINTVMSCIFNKNGIMGAVMAEEKVFNCFTEKLKFIYEALNSEKYETQVIEFKSSNLKEAFTTAGKIQYTAKAGVYNLLDFKYSGKMNVLKTIVNLEYLWNKVRVLGGAYGSGCDITRNGSVFAYSYRDPNICATIDYYNNIYKFLEEFNTSPREMTRFILGSINSIDRPKSNSDKADISLARYMLGITAEMQQSEREEILSTNVNDIRNYSLLFKEAFSRGSICVIGNEFKIKESKSLFDTISPLNSK